MDDTSSPQAAELEALGERIQYARFEKGLSIAELARLIGVAEATMKTWEGGKARPRSNRIPVIAGALSVSMRWLMSGDGLPWECKTEAKGSDIEDAGLLRELRDVRAGMEKSIDRMTQLEEHLAEMLRRGVVGTKDSGWSKDRL